MALNSVNVVEKSSVFSEQNAIEFINKEFGGDIESLSKARALFDHFYKATNSLKNELTYASSEAPSRIDRAVDDADKIAKDVEDLTRKQEELNGDIANHLVDITPTVRELTALMEQIGHLQHYAAYLQCISKVEDFSSDIQSALLINSMERAVRHFSELAELGKTLQSSSCSNLLEYINSTILFWYRILKDKISSEFDLVLSSWRWPFIVSTVKPQQIPNIAEQKQKLGPLFTHLLHLQLPDGLSAENAPVPSFLVELPEWRPVLLPLQLMLKPLKKRFRYHFNGKRQTNSLDKPEWFFTQVLTWIRDHSNFLVTNIQPILDKARLKSVDAVNEFSRGLVILAMEKLNADIPELMYDDHLFSHAVDETLCFHNEMRNVHGYPASHVSCLQVLTQPQPFNKWINIEQKFALEKMDNMLASDTAWHSQYKDIADADDNKLPECTENFITLMVTITERYKLLPSVAHRLRFLELQLELLEDFRMRLQQVKASEASEPLNPCYCAILNTANHLLACLHDWSDNMLQYYRVQEDQKLQELEQRQKCMEQGDSSTAQCGEDGQEDDTDIQMDDHSVENVSLSSPGMLVMGDECGSVFDEMIELYEHMRNELLSSITSYVLDDVKARSRPYRKDRWQALPTVKEGNILGLSSTAYEMMLILRSRLHTVQKLLSNNLFNMLWNKLAQKLDSFLYEEVVHQNFFSEGGAAQLKFDMTRNLFPLFAEYTSKPENYFRNMKEACVILTLKSGSAMLLKDVLYQALHDPSADTMSALVDPVAALHDIGVYKLSLEEAEMILSKRITLDM